MTPEQVTVGRVMTAKAAALPTGAMFFARYAWSGRFGTDWHRTLWKRVERGIASGWASHQHPDLVRPVFNTDGNPSPWEAGANATMTFDPIDDVLAGQIEMLLHHRLYARLGVLLTEEHRRREREASAHRAGAGGGEALPAGTGDHARKRRRA